MRPPHLTPQTPLSPPPHVFRGEVVEFDLNQLSESGEAESLIEMFEAVDVKVELWTMCALECVAIGKNDDAELMVERGIKGQSFSPPMTNVLWM